MLQSETMKTTKPNKAAQAFGRLGGSVNSPKQQRARKRNGKLGGRPGRICIYCHEPVVGGHEDRRLDETCGAHGWHWKKPNDDTARQVKPDPKLLSDVLEVLETLDDVLPASAEHLLSARLIARVRAAAAAGR